MVISLIIQISSLSLKLHLSFFTLLYPVRYYMDYLYIYARAGFDTYSPGAWLN